MPKSHAETLLSLSSRISKRKGLEKAEKEADELTKLYESMESALSTLHQVDIHPHGYVEEIFPMEDRIDERPFLFRVVTQSDDVNALIKSLENTSTTERNWNVALWLSTGSERKGKIIAVSREGDDELAGFAVVRVYYDTDMHGILDEEPKIHLSVNLEAIYIRQSERGKGHSQALSYAIANHVDDLLYKLADLSKSERESFDHLPVEIFVNGEAHSAGGARFLHRTFDRIQSNLHFFNPENQWFKSPELFDNIDFSDFPDCGWNVKDDDENDEEYEDGMTF